VLLAPAVPLWALMALQAGNGVASAFFKPASSGLVQEAVAPGDRQRANALLSATTNVSSIVGPALAALLIAFAGNAWAVGIDALTFGVSALFLIGVVVPPRVLAPRVGLGREIAEGFRTVVQRRWIGLSILGFAEFQLFVLASYSVLGPLIADREYDGAITWALVTSTAGVGALLGDALALRIKPTHPLFVGNLFSLGLVPLLVALALTAPVPVLVVCALFFGISFSLPDTLWFTALQDNVPEQLMARVSSIDWTGSVALRPIGLAIVAPIAVLVGPGAVLVVAAGVTAVTLAGLMASPSVRGLRAHSASLPGPDTGASATGSEQAL
jgi:predicted MFS family arabinose efflux permease